MNATMRCNTESHCTALGLACAALRLGQQCLQGRQLVGRFVHRHRRQQCATLPGREPRMLRGGGSVVDTGCCQHQKQALPLRLLACRLQEIVEA